MRVEVTPCLKQKLMKVATKRGPILGACYPCPPHGWRDWRPKGTFYSGS